MKCITCSKIKAFEAENEYYKKQIVLAKQKRLEAADNARTLAEANYYLENCLCDASLQVQHLRCESKRMIRNQML
jgi:hypothetical protein